MKFLLICLMLACNLKAATKTQPDAYQPPAAQANNDYEVLVTGVCAFAFQGWMQATKARDAESTWHPNMRQAIKLLVPAAVGFVVGQVAGHFVQGSDRTPDDALAALAGSTTALTFRW